MIAVFSKGSISGFIDVREHAFAAIAQPTAPRVRDTEGELCAESFLASVVRRIGRMLERRRKAEIARRNSPLSLDDAWAGGWYARGRVLQEALFQREGSTSTKPAPRRQDWDDKLD